MFPFNSRSKTAITNIQTCWRGEGTRRDKPTCEKKFKTPPVIFNVFKNFKVSRKERGKESC